MSQKPVASQLSLGAPPKHVVQVKVTDQVLLCEYTHHAGIEGTGTGFGGGVGEGYFRLHENNTVTCTFPEDGTSTLACMAMIKVYNETDVQGNITYSTSISAQGLCPLFRVCVVPSLETLHSSLIVNIIYTALVMS